MEDGPVLLNIAVVEFLVPLVSIFLCSNFLFLSFTVFCYVEFKDEYSIFPLVPRYDSFSILNFSGTWFHFFLFSFSHL